MYNDIQKASMSKRISAWLFDGILLVVLMTGLALVLSALLGVDDHYNTMQDAYARYEVEYGVTFGITQQEYEKLPADQKVQFDKASEALSKDQAANYAFNMLISLVMILVTGSVLLAYLALEFLVPLRFGNGQTLGKKIFGVALMRNDSVQLNTISLFVRTVLGKFTIETMVPLLVAVLTVFGGLGIIGVAIFVGIGLLQIVLLIVTSNNCLIHDMLANTVAVDMATQRIFGSDLELLAFKERQHAEKAARQDY